MKHRKLRIAWSVAWGVVALLLCVLWVRSYWYEDVAFDVSGGLRTQVMSLSGSISLSLVEEPGSERRFITGPIINPRTVIHAPQFSFLGFIVNRQPNATTTVVPYWLLVSLCAGLAASAWHLWRFSLRTLLIATTLVAVVLGIIVWLSRVT
jgi:hypothetical protein